MSLYKKDRLGFISAGAGTTIVTAPPPGFALNKTLSVRTNVPLAPSPLQNLISGSLTNGPATTPDLPQQQPHPEVLQVDTPWGLYVGLGAGALVLIGGAAYVIKKRKAASVSGYRRRRRSRRR